MISERLTVLEVCESSHPRDCALVCGHAALRERRPGCLSRRADHFSCDCRRFWRLRRGLVALKHPANVRHRARVLAQARAERIATNGSPEGTFTARAPPLPGLPQHASPKLSVTQRTLHTQRPNCLPKPSQNESTHFHYQHGRHCSTKDGPRSRRSAAMHCTHSLARLLARCTALHGTRTAPMRPRSLREGHSPLEPETSCKKIALVPLDHRRCAVIPSGCSPNAC